LLLQSLLISWESVFQTWICQLGTNICVSFCQSLLAQQQYQSQSFLNNRTVFAFALSLDVQEARKPYFHKLCDMSLDKRAHFCFLWNGQSIVSICNMQRCKV
jgi:hypothetical protein